MFWSQRIVHCTYFNAKFAKFFLILTAFKVRNGVSLSKENRILRLLRLWLFNNC